MSFLDTAGEHILRARPVSRGRKNGRMRLKHDVTLQTQNGFRLNKNFLTQNQVLTWVPCPDVKERASVFASVKQGSFTVEASLLMTFFLLSVYGILYLFLIFHIQIVLQEAVEQTAQRAAQYGYIQENLEADFWPEGEWADAIGDVLQWGMETGLLRQGVLDIVSADVLDHSCIRGGSSGIFFGESRLMETDGMIDVVLRYDVEIPVGFPGMTTFHFVQRSRKRAWIGAGQQDGGGEHKGTEDQVYVTETGTVYHLYEDCTHIKLSVQSVAAGEVQQKRNDNGGIYKACEKCCRQGTDSAVLYITRDGDRYHSTLGCSGLKRQVMAIPEKEAAGRPLCSRCRERREKQQ